MKSLARHIDHLLRDNDCVILPGFGGFIAQSVPAYYVKEEHSYYPPSRSISFNAAITMNDGVLAQSYMKSYGVDYARANYMIDMAIDQLRDALDEEGEVELPRIGRIKQDIYQSVQFVPEASGIASPQYFGLGTFTIKELGQLQINEKAQQTSPIITQTEKTIDVHIHKRALRQMLSTAAVFLLLLMVSMPIGFNKPTDIASLRLTEIVNTPVVAVPEEIADAATIDTVAAIAPMEMVESVATTEPSAAEAVTTEATVEYANEAVATAPATNIEVVEMSTPDKAPVPVETTEPARSIAEKTYHIIVASLPNHRGAEEALNQYTSKGYFNASLVEKDDRVRISLMQFADKDEANEYLKELRKNEKFQNAWLLAVRN